MIINNEKFEFSWKMTFDKKTNETKLYYTGLKTMLYELNLAKEKNIPVYKDGKKIDIDVDGMHEYFKEQLLNE